VGPELRWRLRHVLPAARRPVVAWRNRRLSDADAAVASYPRSGSNWFVMMLGELLVREEVDFRTDPFPVIWVADYGRGRPLLPGGGRAVKTHEPFRGAFRRGIYIVRHPANAAVSHYRGRLALGLPDLDFETFMRAWASGRATGYGPWQAHVESWIDAPAEVLVIRFEDLLADTRRWIGDSLRFLGLERSPGEIEAAVAHNSLDRMREKTFAARDVLRGGDDQRAIRGGDRDWRSDLTSGQVALVAALLRQNAGRAMDRLGYDAGEGG
jgi:hypothetical protein